jgi:Predicted nucleotide-binding protein containing TIR-like domain
MHKDKPGSKKKRVEVPPQPPVLPAVSPGGILELLLVQKKRAEELLKSDFLSIEDVRYWNLFTKEILIKAFGARPEYIEAVIYAGEQKPYSAYEPESSLEKMRRRNFEIALKRLGACMKQLNPESSKADPAEDEEPDDLEEAEDDSPEEGEEEENDEEEIKLPPEKKEGGVDTSRGAERAGKSRRKVFILPGLDEGKKKEITNFLKNMELEPVLPPENPQEMNWMEDLGRGSEVAFALAVLCGDGSGRPEQDHSDAKPRLGQKLAFELGFVAGRLKPGLICVLYEEGFDLPVHLPAGLFLPWDAAGLWKLLVARAMKMANVDVDLNKAL